MSLLGFRELFGCSAELLDGMMGNFCHRRLNRKRRGANRYEYVCQSAAITTTVIGIVGMATWLLNKQARLRDLAELKLHDLKPSNLC